MPNARPLHTRALCISLATIDLIGPTKSGHFAPTGSRCASHAPTPLASQPVSLSGFCVSASFTYCNSIAPRECIRSVHVSYSIFSLFRFFDFLHFSIFSSSKV